MVRTPSIGPECAGVSNSIEAAFVVAVGSDESRMPRFRSLSRHTSFSPKQPTAITDDEELSLSWLIGDAGCDTDISDDAPD